MKFRFLLLGVFLVFAVATLFSCGSSGGSSVDTTAPLTTAAPASSSITTSQNVVLTANEPATIFYTTDGTPAGTNVSGPSPLTVTAAQLGGIGSTTTLFFHSVDVAGNVEQTRIESYSITP